MKLDRAVVERLEKGACVASSIVLSLLAARTLVAPSSEAIARRTFSRRLAEEVVWGEPTGTLGQVHWYSYLLVLAVALLGALVGSRVERPALRRALIAASIVVAFATSVFAGVVACVVVALVGALLAPHLAETRPVEAPSSTTQRALFVLGCASTTFAWGAWITTNSWVFAVVVLCALGAVLVARARSASASTLAADATAGAPVFLLVFASLLRAPSPLWLIGVLFGAALARFVLHRRPSSEVPAWLVACAPLPLVAAVFVPLRFREIPTTNLFHHEGQHLGWINASYSHKLLMADSDMIYGPLREYALVAWTHVASATVEQVRIAHMLLNLGGLALLLVVGWRIVGRRIGPQLLLAYLLLTRTPLAFFIDYTRQINFGWADVLRVAFALFALLGAVRAREERGRRRWIALFCWGIVAGLSILYSQEFGLCTCGAVLVVVLVDSAVRATSRPVSARLLGGARDAGVILVGAALVCASCLAVYAAMGRGRLFLHTFINTFAPIAAGVFGVIPIPLDAHAVVDADAFLGRGPSGEPVFEWALPVAAQIVVAVLLLVTLQRRRWNERSTELFALLVFSVAAFRYALTRSDVYHLLLGSVSSVMLLGAIAGDAAAWLGEGRAPRARLAALFAAAAAVVVVTEATRGASMRASLVARGVEGPTSKTPHFYGDLPRAGDVLVPQDTLEVVRWIRAHTAPTDGVIVLGADPMEGGDILFLSERRNPTRYEMMILFTRDDQVDFYDSIRRDPPAVVLGDNTTPAGADAEAYLRDHWTNEAPAGGWSVHRWRTSQVAKD